MNTQSIYKSPEGEKAIMDIYEKVLSQWPVPREELNIDTRFGKTFVIASKGEKKPPLVLLHGSGANSATWFADVAAYSRKYRVYCVDIPGDPGKSAPERFDWNGPAFSEWLDDVLNGLSIKQTILGGISLGGWASLKYAIDEPEKVEKLVLICPGGVISTRPSFILRMVFWSLMGEWGKKRLRDLFFKNVTLTEEADQFFNLTAKHFNYRQGVPPIFTDEQIKRIKVPVIFLGGKADFVFDTGKAAQRLQELLPDLTIKLYGEKGHTLVNMAEIVIPLLNGKVK